MKRRLVSGYWIEVQTEHVVPHVTVERLGTKERVFLTPEEARQVAAALVKAAEAADQA